MDAENDTEVVKQSTSTMIAVFSGMGLTGISIFAIVSALNAGILTDLVILFILDIFVVICAALLMYVIKKGEKDFNKINV